MSFYGNITNTSKTTFSFDKTYANRYEADLGCPSDGIMSGRYILIEYDADQTEDSYPEYYCYNGVMYSGVNEQTMMMGGNTCLIIDSPNEKLKYTPKSTNEIVRVPIGRRISGLNKYVEYIEVLSNSGDFKYITKNAYQEYLKNTYQNVTLNLDEDLYIGGKFYIKEQYYNTLTNTTTDVYRLEEAYPKVLVALNDYKTDQSNWVNCTQITAEMLQAHVDINGQTATCKNDEVYYIYVEEDKCYAPIGHIAQISQSTDSDGNSISWSEWWSATDERQALLKRVTNTAYLSDFQDKLCIKEKYSEDKDYYLPISEIFQEVTSQVDSSKYAAGSYYYIPNLKIDDDYDMFTADFVLDQNDTYTSGRRYFENGLGIEAWISNENLVFSDNLSKGDCVKIDVNRIYSQNTVTEFWMYNGKNWQQLNATADTSSSSTSISNFLINFAIDMGAYSTSRGYDSTVWQKVFSGGTEKYVMIAELNSVVPTFDIGADAPTLRPLVPHFDADSTNVYYKIHWQPQWGLRIKAANNVLKGPTYTQTGALNGSQQTYLRRQSSENETGITHITDDVFYPSDEDVRFFSREYNTTTDTIKQGFYSTETESWDAAAGEEGTNVPAAIYYNKEGFDSKNIIYSSDYLDETSDRYSADITNSGWEDEDKIDITPTGQSGHLYNTHSKTSDQEPVEDTQEVSIMLPSLGNTIAKIWDIVYGGRDTNEKIKESNVRNQDIAWEDGRASLDRRGLRLVNDNEASGKKNTYSTAEMDTVAGAINSAHDIMGMIINKIPNTDNAEDKLDERIYYNSEDGKYYRRHLTYDFVDLTDEDYVYESAEVTEDDFDPTDLWIKDDDGNYVKVDDDATYDQNQEYYTQTGEVYEEITLDDFDAEHYYYQELTNSVWDSNASDHPEMMNYTRKSTYQPGHTYCIIDTDKFNYFKLSGAYKPNTYYYVNSKNNIVLDDSETARSATKYYTINKGKVITVLNNASAGNFTDIYVPNYYYYQDEKGNVIKDTDDTMDRSRVYYLPKIFETDTEIEYDENGNIIQPEQEYIKTSTPTEIKHTINEEEYNYYQNSAYEAGEESYYYLYDTSTKILTPYKETWATYSQDQPRLWYLAISYSMVNTETKYNIEDMTQQRLVPFTENTFYFEIKDAKTGIVTGYQPVTRNMVKPGQHLTYVAFGYGVYPAGTVLNDKSLTVDTPKQWANDGYPFSVKDGVNYNSVEEWALKELNDFYTSNNYHFMDLDGNIILDTYSLMTRTSENAIANNDGAVYFTIPEDAIDFESLKDKVFYEPYKYYSEGSSGEYIKNIEEEKSEDSTKKYYTREQIYVKEDTRGIYYEGMVWSPTAITVPEGVTLATHKERYELKEIPGFARDINTMHGLLLKLNHYMEYDDKYTRDERIGNGLLNQIHDIIAHIGKLSPRKFMSVDDTGRMIETNWDSRQADTSTKVKTSSLLKGIDGDRFEEVNSIFKMRNQWITMNLDGDTEEPQLVIRHNFQKVTDTTSETDMNDNLDTIELYTPIVDDMGHVVGKNENTVTLPYGFKTISISEASDNVVDLDYNKADIVADNTQDTITITPSNKWIKLNANSETDTLAIGHEVHSFESGTANIQYGLTIDKPITVLDEDNSFIVPTFKFDEAGHITMAEEHTVTLPENFKEIDIITSKNTDDNFAGAEGVVIANSLVDVLTFAEGNKWINIVANDKTISFSHYAKKVTPTSSSKDLNIEGTFTVLKSITIDEAGHITAVDNGSFTLPYNFKTISTLNNNKDTYNVGFAITGSVTANNQVDTVSFDNSNGWITLTADTANNKILIGHGAAGTTVLTKGPTGNTAVKFGDSILIPSIGKDNAGHITNLVNYSITLPQPSLVDDTGNVMTGVELDATTGTFTLKKTNVGTLLLTEYNPISDLTEDNKNSKATVNATDSINTAIAKLQARLVLGEATHANDYTLLSNSIPVIKLDDDGMLTITNGIGTNYTINNVTQETLFTYTDAIEADETAGTEAQDAVEYTVAELTKHVAELEARIAALEKA